jgi:CRP-like cAMP-binding protein
MQSTPSIYDKISQKAAREVSLLLMNQSNASAQTASDRLAASLEQQPILDRMNRYGESYAVAVSKVHRKI